MVIVDPPLAVDLAEIPASAPERPPPRRKATHEPGRRSQAGADPAVKPEIEPVSRPGAGTRRRQAPREAGVRRLRKDRCRSPKARRSRRAVVPPGRARRDQRRQELARVDADLLDQLLNNAGEVSISRSRLKQQVSSIDFNVGELSRTVTRLREQLRKLELETEAQILHRHQETLVARDFDPLELDRYSTIQQFSRALAESASDVGSIQDLLESLTARRRTC